MKLTEYCATLHVDIIMAYRTGFLNKTECKWVARIDKAYYKICDKPKNLYAISGDGPTPDAAILSLIDRIKGLTLVLEAYDSGQYLEYVVPADLTHG